MKRTTKYRSDLAGHHTRSVAWDLSSGTRGRRGGRKAEFAGDRAYSSPDTWLESEKTGL
jgi:hypothetical protein